jgi:hypothetical protein
MGMRIRISLQSTTNHKALVKVSAYATKRRSYVR